GHESRRRSADLFAQRRPLCGRLLWLGRRLGELGRPQGSAADHRRRGWQIGPRFPPAAAHPALHWQALVPSWRVRLEDRTGPPSGAAAQARKKGLTSEFIAQAGGPERPQAVLPTIRNDAGKKG